MPIFLDPWNPDFAGSLQAEPPAEGEPSKVVLTIETEAWKEIAPSSPPPKNFAFVDGVRRVDARIILENETVNYGLLGSVAAGAVLLEINQVNSTHDIVNHSMVERYFVTGGGSTVAESAKVHERVDYLPVSIPENDVQAPVLKLQQLMRDVEGKAIGQIAAKAPDALVIADGPLHLASLKSPGALGYIKSFHEWYLPSDRLPLLTRLTPGTRTPMFLLGGGKRGFPDRCAWFIRLAHPEKGDSPLSGLARLEVGAQAGLEKAKHLADQSCLLSSFASKKYHDPRSPQNLLPIGALEKMLKHLLGDSSLLRRWIQSWIHESRKMQEEKPEAFGRQSSN